LSIYL